jgi:hypothetical protein
VSVRYRVTALRYRFVNESAGHSFEAAAAQAGTLGPFSYTLADGVLTAIPADEFQDRRAARDTLEPLLRGWEQRAFLTPEAHRFRFEYDSSDVEEIDPQPGSVTVFPESLVIRAQAFPPTVVVGHSEYPSPGPTFRRTPLTDTLTERLRRVRDKEAELPSVGYYVLTEIEQAFGAPSKGSQRRERAAGALAVEPAVLDRVGALTARHDPHSARKAGGDPTPYSAAEIEWLAAVIVRLIRRVGEHAAGAVLTPITMVTLPPV